MVGIPHLLIPYAIAHMLDVFQVDQKRPKNTVIRVYFREIWSPQPEIYWEAKPYLDIDGYQKWSWSPTDIMCFRSRLCQNWKKGQKWPKNDQIWRFKIVANGLFIAPAWNFIIMHVQVWGTYGPNIGYSLQLHPRHPDPQKSSKMPKSVFVWKTSFFDTLSTGKRWIIGL